MTRHTEAALVTAARPFRRRLVWLGAVGAVGGLAVVLALAAWSARAGLVRSPFWVVAAWGLGLGTVVLIVTVVLHAARGFRSEPLARRLEAAPGWRRGLLRGLLEPPLDGTSAELRDAADRSAADQVVAEAGVVLSPDALRLGRLLAGSFLSLAGGGLLLGAAGVRSGPASLLWQPRRALEMIASPLRIRSASRNVAAGDSVTLHVEAPGRHAVTLWTRSPGTTWTAEPLTLDSLGVAERGSGPLNEPLYAYVSAGRRSSDTVEIAVRRPAFLATLALTIRYPGYLHLEDEPVPAGLDTLLLPAGSRIETRGEATVPISTARWEAQSGVATGLAVSGAGFSGSLAPQASGVYRLVIETAEGGALQDQSAIALRILPDQPPVVEVPVPSGDTIAPAAGSLAIVVDAKDDHGLADAALERRVTHAGVTHPLSDEALPLPGQTPDRAILPGGVDVSALGLAPGDTLRITARVRDNSPAHQVARSREIAIAVPTRGELRSEEKDRARAVQQQLDSLVAQSRQAQRQTEDLGREQQRGNENTLDFDAAKKAEGVAERQEQLLKQAEDVRRSLEEMRQAAERAGLTDTAFLNRMKEVQEQLDQALSPELRRQLAELQEALKSLDREKTREAVRRLGDQQEKLRDALERSRELFKRAALEGQLASLEQETREVKEQQEQWNEQVSSADSARAAAEEKALANRTDSVAAGLNQAARQLEEARKKSLQEAAEEARQAAEEMRQGARSAQQGQSQQARQSGRRASQRMQKVQKDVQEQREGQQQEWKQEVIDALDRALLETTRLAERQLTVTEQFRRGASESPAATRAAQGALEEGVGKLLQQVADATGKNALVSPQILAALAEARQQMSRAREASASASGSPRESVDRAGDAVDALNVAAYGLLRSRDDVSGSGSGSGFAEAMERMTKLAKQQGQLSQDANGMLPMAGTSALQQQLQSLAARQRALAQELERLRAQGQLDAKPLSDEAKDLARALERGRLDREMVERQERLFRRMLDAGRTLQGREDDERKERQSETAKPGEVHLPPSLRAQLQGKNGDIRLPTWDQLQRLSPEERRLVTDYFRRLAGGAP